MCFCETWLTPSEPSPIVQNNQVAIRCDRPFGDNKGGVMISIPDGMQPINTRRYAPNGIEAVSTILLLANNTPTQIAPLYTYRYVHEHAYSLYLHNTTYKLCRLNTVHITRDSATQITSIQHIID